ncbi:hypothetical protein I9189_015890 [Acinetobacter bereziniae]|uniref:hypothetical protein n=1 Tax=Acinetobacter bereziniae TaxID=106648 RepID=UPI0019040120|nr:hypothetical protein [Acinetobacter bereziniae]QQC79466.1 hypothetical protein I9192_16025 [Acinetobacter bereziniae]UUN92543.1 hypothetical protein I9189_015890 [Acinetobacter bereziniae]
MSKEILAQDLNDANDQWNASLENYSNALCEYCEAKKEILMALGVQTDFEKTSWSAEETIADLRLNQEKYALLNRFRLAVEKVNSTKSKL